MKTTSKFLSLLLVSLFGIFSAFAQVTTSGTFVANTTTLALSVPASVLTLTIYDNSGATNPVVLYDLASASSTNLVRAAYTSRGQHLTNRVTSYTNPLGVATLITNTVMFYYDLPVAATTNEANRVLYTVLPANGSLTPTDTTLPLGVSRGLVIRGVGAGSYTVTYVPQL
jgi:hypothetical protein